MRYALRVVIWRFGIDEATICVAGEDADELLRLTEWFQPVCRDRREALASRLPIVVRA